jgi:methyl-accepting chemotaxis protein
MVKKMIYNMNLKKKLYIIFGVIIVATALGIGVGVSAFSRVQVGGKTYGVIERNMLIADNIAKLRADLAFVRTTLLTMIIDDNADRRTSLQQDVNDLSKRIDELFGLIDEQLKSSDYPELVENLRAARDAWTAFTETRDEELIPAILGGKTNAAMTLARGVQSVRYLTMSEETKKAVDRVRAQVPEMVAQMKRESSFVQISFIVGGFFIVIFYIIVAFFFSKTIIIPVGLVSDRSAQMAQGNFSQAALHARGTDEIGAMITNFSTMTSKVGDAAARLKMSIMNLSSSSKKLSTTAESLGSGAAQQTHQAKEVAAATTQMSQTISEVAQNAVQAADAAKNSSENATAGKELVKRTVERLASITDTVGEAAQTIEELGKSSGQIGEIVNLIHTIADQTNLLALNAAIEAARAGEQGRGFAVVADEVRKLADRTTSATKDIEQKISTIQAEAKKSLVAVKKGNAEVEKGVGLAKSASEALDTIVMASTQVLDMVQRIAVATEEQSATAEEITRNMGTISEVTDHSSESTNQIQQAAHTLAQLALEIQSSLSWFRTEGAQL